MKDGLHPLGSYATPANGKPSHPARQYDEPVISVIIPVGPGHEQEVVNALDSLEAQTFRKWEAVVVWDSPDRSVVPALHKAYPYARLYFTRGEEGAGKARNVGAAAARAPLLVFLDADDWLYPRFMERVLTEWGREEAIIYTDSVAKVYLDDLSGLPARWLGRILHRDAETGETVISRPMLDYDCERAVRQPLAPFYIWCNVTALVPAAWHDEIGGFDEQMEAWEDWDYWIRMARAGKCFRRIPEPLMVYRYYTGQRREKGRNKRDVLVQYMRQKFDEEEVSEMACAGCGRRRSPTRNSPFAAANPTTQQTNDDQMVLIEYRSPNVGEHPVVGPATGQSYGYHCPGQRFRVHRADAQAAPDIFRIVEVAAPERKAVQEAAAEPAEEAKPERPPDLEEVLAMIEEEQGRKPKAEVDRFNLRQLPGISGDVESLMRSAGIETLDDILVLGEEGLLEFRGIGRKRAKQIMDRVRELLGVEEVV